MPPPRITELGTAPDGKPFRAIAIGEGVLTAHLLTFGATLQDLRLAGHAPPLVLGYKAPTDYFNNRHMLGAIVGRVANRIAHGRFTLDGRSYELDRNEGGVQTLHGGAEGVQAQSWELVDHAADHATLALTLADGHMGFPGRLALRCDYRIAGAALFITLRARTDAPTFCNLASHAYYNLSGAPTAQDHLLQVSADSYLPKDDRGIPLGAPALVAGTPLDHRTPRPTAEGLDHNFCLAPERRALIPAVTLEAGGIRMTLSTTEAGVQVYDGVALDKTGQIGLCGVPYGPRAGIALEPQAWPDAPNQPWAGQALLRPGETCESVTRLEFVQG